MTYFHQLSTLSRPTIALVYPAVSFWHWACTAGFLPYIGKGDRVSKDWPGEWNSAMTRIENSRLPGSSLGCLYLPTLTPSPPVISLVLLEFCPQFQGPATFCDVTVYDSSRTGFQEGGQQLSCLSSCIVPMN